MVETVHARVSRQLHYRRVREVCSAQSFNHCFSACHSSLLHKTLHKVIYLANTQWLLLVPVGMSSSYYGLLPDKMVILGGTFQVVSCRRTS